MLQRSSLDLETELVESQGVVSTLLKRGPRPLGRIAGSLKCKVTDSLEPPRFHRGFVWLDSDKIHSSPSALYTETAPPLPSPPRQLLDDLKIQEALHLLGDAIKVETPFDVDKFELLLTDHPNQPFIKSVMKVSGLSTKVNGKSSLRKSSQAMTVTPRMQKPFVLTVTGRSLQGVGLTPWKTLNFFLE